MLKFAAVDKVIKICLLKEKKTFNEIVLLIFWVKLIVSGSDFFGKLEFMLKD